MIVWQFSEHDIQQAAERSQVKVANLRRDGKGWRFTLALAPGKRWQKVSVDRWHSPEKRRRAGNHVCWHGHYAFMRELFRQNESGRIKATRLCDADYRGLSDFLAKAPGTGLINVGSMVAPVQAFECCDCLETGDFIISTL